ncbi:prolipoprotein diacylglyceryl transferase [Aurantivibrio plasticivorans]
MKIPNFDPVAISLGPLQVHWYGIMYLLAFASAWFIAMYRAKKPGSPISVSQVEDLVLFAAIGTVVGGRIGYVVFYNFEAFMLEPLWLFRVWEGGMSFHGGFLGVVTAMALYARKHKINVIQLLDFIGPMVPLGLMFGRIGNFIGQELWGRATDVPWGVIFPDDRLQLVRHPSQLYEAALEGLVLFVVLFVYSMKPRPRGTVCGLGISLYAIFRIAVEFTREPDAHIQFDLFGWMTRGQILSIPMLLVGLLLIMWGLLSARSNPVESSK